MELDLTGTVPYPRPLYATELRAGLIDAATRKPVNDKVWLILYEDGSVTWRRSAPRRFAPASGAYLSDKGVPERLPEPVLDAAPPTNPHPAGPDADTLGRPARPARPAAPAEVIVTRGRADGGPP